MNQKYLGGLLVEWGDWVDRAAVHTGYPTESSTVGAKEAMHTHTTMKWALPGGGSFRYAIPNRHAILCFDMPGRLVRIHQRILMLRPRHQGALTYWYAYGTHMVGDPESPKLEGKPMIWHREDKAVYLGMSYDALERLVSRARANLARFFEAGIARPSEKVLQISTME